MVYVIDLSAAIIMIVVIVIIIISTMDLLC